MSTFFIFENFEIFNVLTVSAQTGALAMDSGGSSAMRMQSQPYLSLLRLHRGRFPARAPRADPSEESACPAARFRTR